MEALAAAGTKQAYRELLGSWRTGSLERALERRIDDLLAQADSSALVDAAGALLLEEPAHAPQREGLCALLAGEGSELAAGYLLAAADRPVAGSAAREALATVSEPGLVPLLAREVGPESSPELLAAVAQALRNMEVAKARELEERIRALRSR